MAMLSATRRFRGERGGSEDRLLDQLFQMHSSKRAEEAVGWAGLIEPCAVSCSCGEYHDLPIH